MPMDVEKCLKNNIHNRSAEDIRKAINQFVLTPATYTVLDYECLFHNADDTEEISDMDEERDGQGDSLDAISDDENANADKELDEVSGEDETVNEVK